MGTGNETTIMSTMKHKATAIAQSFGLSLIVLFGSQATGRLHKGSDVDVGFLSETPISFEKELLLRNAFMEILKRDDVELVNLQRVSPQFMRAVVRESVVVFQKNKTVFDTLAVYAHKLYIEAAPLRTARTNYIRTPSIL